MYLMLTREKSIRGYWVARVSVNTCPYFLEAMHTGKSLCVLKPQTCCKSKSILAEMEETHPTARFYHHPGIIDDVDVQFYCVENAPKFLKMELKPSLGALITQFRCSLRGFYNFVFEYPRYNLLKIVIMNTVECHFDFKLLKFEI